MNKIKRVIAMLIVIIIVINFFPTIDMEAKEKSILSNIENYISEAVLPYADIFQIDTTRDIFLGMAMPTFIKKSRDKLSLLEHTCFYPLTDGEILWGLIEVDSYRETYSFSFICMQSQQLRFIKYPVVVIEDRKIKIESGDD